MKKLAVMFVLLLVGCVDLGRVGTHPDMKQVYLKGYPHNVADCLFAAAQSQHLRLERDGRLTQGIEKYNLTDRNYDNVAWIEIAAAGRQQSSVTFYYAKEPDVSAAVSAMAARCKDSRF